MASREERRRALDEGADLYDRYRPGYPDQIVDDVVWLSGIPPHGQIVEIGCGTGHATMKFARRDYEMFCIEPGANLARIAERKCAPFTNVRVVRTSFEQWAPGSLGADLVLAAQSFHLVDPTVGMQRAARLLRPGGAMAIMANRPLRGEGELRDRIQHAYLRHAPGLAGADPEIAWDDQIDATGLFGTVVVARYRWLTSYSTSEYLGLLQTQSLHRLLPADQRAALLGAIGAAVTQAGGNINVNYLTTLHLAKRIAAEPLQRPWPDPTFDDTS